MPKTKETIPILRAAKPLPKEGWSGAEIEQAVEELYLTESIGEALRAAREAQKLSGTKLAQRLGIGRSRISQLERKDHDLALHTLYRVLDALGYDLELTFIPREGGKVITVARE
jgi:ribosome-binding protein aMBF1 (putative translation factor)